MEEVWKDIAGYEGRYQVSSLGRVKSLPNRIRKSELILKQSTHKRSEHRLVNLTSNEGGAWKQRSHWVHRLVLEAFVGPCPEGMEGCHNDGNSTNNVPGNLRWDTHEGNIADVRKHGTLRGENNGRAILTEEQAIEIKGRIANGESDDEIATLYPISARGIKNIRNGYNWRHL